MRRLLRDRALLGGDVSERFLRDGKENHKQSLKRQRTELIREVPEEQVDLLYDVP